MTKEPLVRGDADLCVCDLAVAGLSAQLPHQLADLCDGLGGNGFAEAAKPAACVHRDTAPDCGVAVSQQALGFAGLAQADVLVPIELERRRQFVAFLEL